LTGPVASLQVKAPQDVTATPPRMAELSGLPGPQSGRHSSTLTNSWWPAPVDAPGGPRAPRRAAWRVGSLRRCARV